MSEKLMFKPGTVVVMLFIAALGFGIYSWTSHSVSDLGENAEDRRRQTVRCAGIDADFVGLDRDGGEVTVFFQINRRVNTALVEFRGDRNVTRRLTDLGENSLQNVSADLEEFRKVLVNPLGCDQVFEYSE